MKKFLFFLLFPVLISGCAGLEEVISPTPGAFIAMERLDSPPPVGPEAQERYNQARSFWVADVCVQPEQAVTKLDETLKIQPDFAEAYLWRGVALSEMGFHHDAFDDITNSIRIYPTALAYGKRSVVNMRLNNFAGAARDLEYALPRSLPEEKPLLYVYRSALYFLEGNTKLGCADLEQVCTLGDCSPLEKQQKAGFCV